MDFKTLPFEAASNLAVTLSDLMDGVESDFGRLGGNSGKVAEGLLLKLDEIQVRLAKLREDDRELGAEASQWNYIGALTRKNARLIIRQVGGVGCYKELRAAHSPDSSRWWWYLDEYLLQEQKTSLKRLLRGVLIGIGVIAILVVAYERFLAPSPQLRAKLNHQDAAFTQVAAGNLASALDETNQGLTFMPEDVQLLMLKGVLLQKLNRAVEADQVYSQVLSKQQGRENFLAMRALLWVQMNDPALAEMDALEMITTNPQSAQGYYYYGLSQELLGKTEQAINAYQKASTLADQLGQDELNATIRMHMGFLMQSVQVKPFATESPVSTP